MLVAQVGAGYSLVHLVVIAIIVAAVIGIALVAIRASGVALPGWVMQIFWIVVVAVVAIFAIKLLLSMV
jgi:hypothetical protein